jgi:hypothetical protein
MGGEYPYLNGAIRKKERRNRKRKRTDPGLNIQETKKSLPWGRPLSIKKMIKLLGQH